MIKADILVNLLKWQIEVINSPCRFKHIRAGRRTGKTFLALCWIIKRAGEIPNGIHWLVGTSSQQVRDLYWGRLQQLIPSKLVLKKSEQFKEITLTNGSVIALKSAESTDNLRGMGLDSLVCEEAAFWQEFIYDSILRPQLADRNGHVMFISSPNGSNWFRRIESMITANQIKDGKTWHFTIYDNSYIPREEIETIKQSTPSKIFEQEFLAEYRDDVGHVYCSAIPNEWQYNGIITATRTVIGTDWGLDDDTAGVVIDIDADGFLYASNDYSRNNQPPGVHAEAFKSLLTNKIVIARVLDSSAWRRDGTSMTSIADEFARNGFRCNPATKQLDSSISIVKTLLEQGVLKIGPLCKNVLNALHVWQYGEHEPDVLAALRYGVAYIYDHNLSQACLKVKLKLPINKANDPISTPPPEKCLPIISKSMQFQYDCGED